MTRKSDPRTTRQPVPQGELPDFTPVPRQHERHDGWTPERQRAFIEALADTGSVQAACKAVDMAQRGAYYLRRQPGAESFREAWEKALDLGVQRVEDVVMDRALNGVEEPLYSYGKLIGTRQRYNDRLLMFILRNRAPQRFADGRPKGLNAIDEMHTKRLKKEWRREWETEQEAQNTPPAEIRSSIDKKIAEICRRLQNDLLGPLEKMSDETRAAWAHFKTLRDRDKAALEQAAGLEPGSLNWQDHEDAVPPPPKELPAPPPPPKTQWTVMDESFDP